LDSPLRALVASPQRVLSDFGIGAGDRVLDHIFLIAVLGEIPDRRLALAEFRRVLRTPGFLSIAEQLPDPDFITRKTLRRGLSAAGFTEERTRGHLFHTSTWRLAASVEPSSA
jgi:ubiquinone/menaquinone biosynthesis C-methylase UbiE